MNWLRSQLENVKLLAELLLALLLNAILILFVWGIRELLIIIMGGIDIKDKTIWWVVYLSQISTITLLAIYILTDILRHILKSIKMIKESLTGKKIRQLGLFE